MNITSNKVGEHSIVFHLEGNFLGENDGKALTDNIKELFDGEMQNIFFDLELLNFINSTGLNVFLGAHKKAEDLHKNFALVKVTDQVDKLLDITKLDSIIAVFDTVEDALKEFNK